MSAAAHRVRQGLVAIGAALRPTRGAAADGLASTWLSGDLRDLFNGMSSHDRAHAARVATRILADGGLAPSSDLMVAALLHDVAKGGTPAVPGRVRLLDRTARVLLGRFAPRLLAIATRRPTFPGLYLAVHHARFGADLVRDAGGSERACWLIAAHESEHSDDPDLHRLIAADDASV